MAIKEKRCEPHRKPRKRATEKPMKVKSNGLEPTGPSQNGHRLFWKQDLSAYRDLAELRFTRASENRKALDLLEGNDLCSMPYSLTGDGIVVPVEAVHYFEAAGKFSQKKVHRR
jgi:hypothetical protein